MDYKMISFWPFLKSKLALRAGTDLATLILLSKTTQQS